MLPPKTWGSDSSGSLSSGALLPCSEGSARTELTLPKGWAGSGAFTPQVRLREKEAGGKLAAEGKKTTCKDRRAEVRETDRPTEPKKAGVSKIEIDRDPRDLARLLGPAWSPAQGPDCGSAIRPSLIAPDVGTQQERLSGQMPQRPASTPALDGWLSAPWAPVQLRGWGRSPRPLTGVTTGP